VSAAACLDGAIAIGAALRRDAWWHEGRCNWIGHAPDEALPGRPQQVAPLGPELYGGTAGVALFLAELAAVTGERELERTVEGALAHAWSRLERIAPASRISAYSGWIGIGWASLRAGVALGRAELVERGRALMLRALDEPAENRALDVVAGTAGAILALLAADRAAAAPALTDGALLLADALADAAIRDGDTVAWETRRASGSDLGAVPATGFAHGASGMGLALLEAGVRGGRDHLRAAALGAFRYERRWFDALKDNWPDLRGYNPQLPREQQPLGCGVAWCHGAPGIGLARSRALALAPDEELRRDEQAAARTTRKQLEQYRQGARLDLAPCHGLAGLGETLLAAEPSSSAMLAELWAPIVARHAAADDWPSGLPTTNKMRSLMLGTAGVGHALLRLCARDRVPSILLLGGA
jgi:lantibiotic modifying enzyme